MNRMIRFILTVQGTSASGKHTFDEIVYIREFKPSDWGNDLKRMRTKFLSLCRYHCAEEYKNPTKKIHVEYH